MTQGKKPPSQEDELFDFETQLIVAWPGPTDPPPRKVRLPGVRIEAWPQRDGSVLYEIKYRGKPYTTKTLRPIRDTLQIGGGQKGPMGRKR